MMNSVLAGAGLRSSDLNAIAFANGPGAFTGVRIAAATAQGLAIGLSVPLIAISTLAALSQQACDSLSCDRVQAALDARMSEAYCAHYCLNLRSGLVELEGNEQLVKLDQLHPVQGGISAGSGFKAWREAGNRADPDVEIHEDILPTAAAVVKLARQAADQGRMYSADHTEINYLRNQVAEKPAVR
jgi:tRNA threonylcarbamoyladenosine biosynthesis protein TsaB